jgi:hypothetical protein
MAEEYAKLKAAIARKKPAAPDVLYIGNDGRLRSAAETTRKHTRRDVVRGLLIGAVASTGLARTGLELVAPVQNYERGTVTFRGVELAWTELEDAPDPPIYLINPDYSPPLQWWKEPRA